MKKYFLKMSGLAAIVLMLHITAFAQDDDDNASRDNKMSNNDEIIIKRKGNKDEKITVEIRDGKVFINDKPIDEFNDDNVIIKRKKVGDEDIFLMAPGSPFRSGAQSFSGNGASNNYFFNSNSGFLGVSSEKADNGGAVITEVTKGSAAEKTGLKKGDIITKIDDSRIDDPDDLTSAIRGHKPDDKVVVTYMRDNKEQKATATLGKLDMNFNYNYNYNFKMPLKMPQLDKQMKIFAPGDFNQFYVWNDKSQKIGIKAQDLEEGKGAKVLDVDDESPADKAGIKEGDIITQLDGREVNDASQLAELARAARTKSSFKVKLTRDGKSQEVEVKIPKKLKTADL